jgi:hypothetical protein
MEKTELLKMMNIEQLIRIVNIQNAEIKDFKNERIIKEVEVETLQQELGRLKVEFEKVDRSKRFNKKWANERLSSLESIARSFNKNKGCTKSDEIFNLATQNNIFSTLQDNFELDKNGSFIGPLTKELI